MIQIVEKAACCGCGICAAVCPQKCIKMIEDEEGFLYPQIKSENCTNCELCRYSCPMQFEETSGSIEAYAVINTNETERMQSTSGGVFPLLARETIRKGGSVVGVSFADRFDRAEFSITKSDPLLFCGSKYMQADLSKVYLQIKELCRNDSLLLIVGLPCQIAALRKSIRGQDGILLVEVACHGVPSSKIWREYLEFLEHKYRGKAKSVSFRDKATGWKGYSVSINFENGRRYRCPGDRDLFMRSYRMNFNLRPSCYECKFKLRSGSGDLQMADFWGIEQYRPDLDDDKGTSLLIVKTPNGEEALKCIQDAAKVTPVELKKALAGNPTIAAASQHPEKREEFFLLARKTSAIEAMKQYCSVSMSEKKYDYNIRMKQIIKRLIGVD